MLSADCVSIAGPDLGVASLTFQAFYEAKYGEAAWDALDKIPKEEWMAYLMWYRCAVPCCVMHIHLCSRDGHCILLTL